eukprot:NODE_485_length_6930_cov_0.490411.p5 type:complete len:201 gc:universal NODE_485_length_6930_cov_0.490411:3770-3168(-)
MILNIIVYFLITWQLITIIIPPNGFDTFNEKNKDYYVKSKKSLQSFIFVGTLSPILLFLAFYYNLSLPNFGGNPITDPIDITAILGCGTCLFGVALRRLAFKLLDKHFTYNVSIQKEHKLIKSGPYKYIRHPSYTGMIFAYVGFAIYIKMTAVGVFQILAGMAIMLILRIRNEEAALLEHFKEDYKKYKSETFALIPFLY